MIDANLEKRAGRGFFKTILLAFTIAIIIIVVLFLILIVYLLIRNPFGIGDALLSHFRTSEVVEDSSTASGGSSANVDNPLLSDSQEAILEKIGVDVSSLPSTITPEMETCFVEKLGQSRVDEIVAGESPGIFDALKAESCLK